MTTPPEFHIVPHVGIGPVRLGMSPDEVEAALVPIPGALPASTKGGSGLCYFRNSLQVEFGRSGTAQFIGVSSSTPVVCTFEGQDAFDLPAPELFAFIAARERGGPHEYQIAEYLFPDQAVTLYEAAEQYDHKGGGLRPIFAEVGVGNREYLDAVAAIRARRAARRAARGASWKPSGEAAAFLSKFGEPGAG